MPSMPFLRRLVCAVVVVASGFAAADAGDDGPQAPPKAAARCTRLTGVVVDSEGKPIEGASVAITDHRGGFPPHHMDFVATAASGRFAYDDLVPEERYRV